MKRLYVDMDGTLAVFNNQIESEEVLYQQGYYRNLPPQQNVIDAVRILSRREDIEIFVLSAVLPTPYAQQEKDAWLNDYLPEIDSAHRIYVPCGEDKGKYIGHTLGKDDLLLDDYSKNLHSWCPPGSAIKLMNGINGNFRTWQGNRVSMDQPAMKISEKLLIALGVEKRTYKNYEIIEVQKAGYGEVVIGKNVAEGGGAPFCVWRYLESIGYHDPAPAELYGEAYQILLQRVESARKFEETERGAANAMTR